MQRDVEIPAGAALWVPAQTYAGENLGASETHSMFIEFKNTTPPPRGQGSLGPPSTAADPS